MLVRLGVLLVGWNPNLKPHVFFFGIFQKTVRREYEGFMIYWVFF